MIKEVLPEHKSQFIDFRLRRSVHIAILSQTHKDLRKALVERELSMQEMFQRFSELVVSADKRIIKLLDELERDKRSGNLTKRASLKVDNRSAGQIYDIIAKESTIESLTLEDEDEDV